MVSVLEIVFVGQCEVFVCLDFVLTFFIPLAVKLIGRSSLLGNAAVSLIL